MRRFILTGAPGAGKTTLIQALAARGHAVAVEAATDVNAELIDEHGVQIAPLHYPHLSHTEIFESVETFYKSFYFRPGKIGSIVSEMVRSPEMMKRRLREGVEFFEFLRERKKIAA